MENNCRVVVSSCHSYEDTWYPFFLLMEQHWADRPYPIVLNNKSKSFKFNEMDIKILIFINVGKRYHGEKD